MRRQQIRRRRTIFGAMALVVAIAAVALSVGTGRDASDGPAESGSSGAGTVAGDQSAGTRTADSTGSGETAAGVAGARPDSTWKRSRGPVPILMYHVIGEPAGEVAYPDLYLSTGDFRAQVEWLRDNGYTAVTLSQVQDAWYDGATLPPKPIVLSFDDGYLGQYLDAMPILRKAGWAGLLNLKAEGSDLSTNQVKKMIAAGWEIGSHTITHPDLRSLSGPALREEVAGSKRQLERDLGVKIENFCYPAGMYDDEARRAVEDAGYRGATTVNPGLGERDMPFELNRIRIDRGDGPEALGRKLASAGA